MSQINFEDLFKQEKTKKIGIGVEHEKILFHGDGSLLEYDTHIKAFLNLINHKFEGSLDLYESNPIGWKKGEISVTLEPGSQFELNGALHNNLKSLKKEFEEHVNFLKFFETEAEIFGSSLGMNPFYNVSQIPIIPKKRYGIMYPYMETKGRCGKDMMKRSATIQANLDYFDPEDFRRKFQASMFISPLFSALVSHSPLSEGKFNGRLSNRIEAWQNTDPERCGLLEFVYSGEFNVTDYIDWALNITNYFDYNSADTKADLKFNFSEYLQNNSDISQEKAKLDFETHLSTLFPEVRAKRFLELRSFDLNQWDLCLAISAFCFLAIYNEENLNSILKVQAEIPFSEFDNFYRSLPTMGIETKIGSSLAYDVIKEVFDSVCADLDEDHLDLLKPLKTLIECRRTPAEFLIEKFKGEPITDRAKFVKTLTFTKTFDEIYFK